MEEMIKIQNIDAFNNLANISHIFINESALLQSNDCEIVGLLLLDHYVEMNVNEKSKIKNYFKIKTEKLHSFPGIL